MGVTNLFPHTGYGSSNRVRKEVLAENDCEAARRKTVSAQASAPQYDPIKEPASMPRSTMILYKYRYSTTYYFALSLL